jgi:cytoskeleton protein RodZ
VRQFATLAGKKMTSDDEKKSADDSRSRDLSPGKLLVWARERSNLTQEQVAKELYMTLTKVRALESDDYRYMGADTFVRGYLRAYANLVHLDVTQVLAAYDRHLQKLGVVESPTPRRTDSANKPMWQFGLFILIALVVLWLISIWFFDNRQQSSVIDRPANVTPQLDISHPVFSAASSALESESGVVVPDESAVVSSAEIIVSASSVNAEEAQSSSSISSASTSSSRKVSGIINTSLAVNDSDLAVLRLSFSAECWLEVSDARGDVLAADLQAAGSSLQLKGEAPFDVKLGNAPAVKIELNGEPVVVTPLSATNVLSLKVGQ